MKYLVFDVGGTAIKYALMTDKAEFIEKGKIPTPKDKMEDFVDVIGSVFDQYRNEIEGIAISMPGRIDSDRGYAYTGGSLLYNYEKNIASILGERCPVPISVENDGKCAALAEAWIGSLADCDDGIVVVLGTGIGGGIIKDKKLHKGRHFTAGEFSFIFTNDSSDNGKNPEMWAEGGGYRSLLRPLSKVKGIPLEELDGHKFFELANNGDEEALKVLDDYCYKLVIQLYNLQYIFDPEKIAIGGGISAQDILFEYIEKNIKKCEENLVFKIVIPEVIKCKFRNDSNLIGALYNFLTNMKDKVELSSNALY
jgi:predicted NBD/HSP70 family sugar kinase